jgi:hypothetical protein
MDIKTAKEYYHLGVIAKIYAVVDALNVNAWCVVIEGTAGQSWDLKTALGKIKSYKSFDTLIEEIRSITGRVSSLVIQP